MPMGLTQLHAADDPQGGKVLAAGLDAGEVSGHVQRSRRQDTVAVVRKQVVVPLQQIRRCRPAIVIDVLCEGDGGTPMATARAQVCSIEPFAASHDHSL